MMDTIRELIRETRIESLCQLGRPRASATWPFSARAGDRARTAGHPGRGPGCRSPHLDRGLLSFPVLVAFGIPPVVANASNTVDLISAGLSGSFDYRQELREHPNVTGAVIVRCSVGAVSGAALPPRVFDAVVPWLILFTCRLVGAQPWITRWLRRHHDQAHRLGPRTKMSPVTAVFATLPGVYGGYFGAGSGVLAKRDYLNYPQALAAGWPIATGIIEGACRHLVKDRLDLTGARWGLQGAEAILKLRALRSNGDFEQYWTFHLNNERHQVHQARYADMTIPTAA